MWKRDQSVASPEAQRERPVIERRPDVVEPRSDVAAADRSGPSGPPGSLVMDLGDSVFIKGELSGSEDLTLCGQMQGSVKLPDHTLTIGPNAKIDAEITAKAVVVTGAVVGNVTASERVAIEGTGSVTGDIVSPVLAVADGGFLLGRVDMNRVRQPTP
jgi:cytoskeletal protein CcmA (bactofilin family)